MKSNSNNARELLISVVLAFGLWALFYVANQIVGDDNPLARVLQLLGGTTSGYIQFMCYAGFIYAIIQLRKLNNQIKEQFKGFEMNILPEEDQLILTPEEVADIKLSVIQIEKRGVFNLITKFIKNACTQYRNDKSIPDTLQVLDVQIDNAKNEMDGKLSMIRYVISGVMSVGFIGTILGLTSAIGNAHLAKTEEGLSILTSYLGVAFDTTLVALLLGLFLNYSYHKYMERMDVFFATSKSYIVDNLISRIYSHA